MNEWLTLELTPRGESEDPDLVRKSLGNSLKGVEIFIPVAITKVGGDKAIHFLLEGYVFVRLDRSRPLGDYFKLEGTKYVQTVLIKGGSGDRNKRLSTVADVEIMRMKRQIRKLIDQGISIGDQVTITSGPYKNITATVFEDFPEEDLVQVSIKLRSQESLVTLPRSFLVVEEKAPYSALSGDLTALYDWALLAKPLFQWTADMTPLLDKSKQLTQVVNWSKKGRDLYDLITFDTTFKPDLEVLKTKSEGLAKVVNWDDQFNLLFPFVSYYYEYLTDSTLAKIQETLKELVWLEGVLERTRSIWDEVEKISKTQARRQEGKGMVQNVLVDGHNLAFRCFHAPGMKNLIDSKGRPTGTILGFLRSLGSLKKRYPAASIYVTWDGSSKRRKSRFGEYKANRPAHNSQTGMFTETFSPIKVLFEVLPFLGVRQAWNPDEEADDVLASLARGLLAKQTNVIFSTDKDLLQLVTPSTSVLLPAIGSRNEILFNPAGVERILGVPPDKLNQLRAFYGDSSDNIPGVPRVPKKILRSLIQAYGSVDAVYNSGLMGVTKGQYERLRSAEPQVRINVDLLNLVDVEVSHIVPDVDPEIAARMLRDLDINPDPLLETFFGETS